MLSVVIFIVMLSVVILSVVKLSIVASREVPFMVSS
jgi:hypothetical protein